MKLVLLGLCVACCVTFSGADAEELREHLKETRELVRSGKYAEALDRYEWAYAKAAEDGQSFPSVTIIHGWHDLGEKYPPAMAALHEVRNRSIKSMLETGGNFNTLQQVKMLNRTFKCEPQTLDLFEQVVKNFPENAPRYWIIVKDEAIAAERYDLATLYMPDLELEFIKLKTSHELLTAMAKRGPANARLEKAHQDHFANNVQQIITVGLNTGKPELAAQVQKDALAVMDDPRIRDAIPAEPAKPAEKPPTAD